MSDSRKQTKSSQVQQSLLNEIIAGKFSPGEKLTMEVLKQHYGVAYSALREALSGLVANGIVERIEQCGFRVSELSLAEFHDLYNIRIHLECLALELAIQNGDEQWEVDVLTQWHLYEKFLQTPAKKIISTTWSHYHDQYRFTLIKACKSPWLLKIRTLLHNQALRYRMICYQNSNDEKTLKKVLTLNKRLTNATLKRDKEQAVQLLKNSWDESIKSILKSLQPHLKK